MKLPSGRGSNRIRELSVFAENLKELSGQIKFKMSSRGWCYTLEGASLISKGEFDHTQRVINEARRKGLLPVDFVAEDQSRSFEGIETPTLCTPLEHLAFYLNQDLRCWDAYTPDWWAGEDYYIQMLVEKVDLRTLFAPICKEYHIPIANAKGWSSILQRADFAR